MFKPFMFGLVLGSLALAACAGAAATPAPIAVGGAPEQPLYAPAATSAPASEGDLSGRAGLATGTDVQERLVIKNASLTLVVADAEAALTEVSRMADEMGGWVVTSYAYKTSYASGADAAVEVTQASITLRVPAERLTEALDRVKAMAVEVRNENVSGQDVTGEYTDLKSRLKNLEAAEAQLQNIMDSATKTEDVLAVYSQLVSVREQIEVILGQMKYYEESAAFSSISLELIPDVLSQPIEIGGWRPEGTAKEALEALIQALQFLADAVIWVGICVVPIAVLFGLPGWFVFRAVRRRMKKAKAAPAA